MKRQYFNRMELKKILSIKESDPKLCVKLFEEYIEKYPKDYPAYPYYINQLINLNRLDDAEKMVKNVNDLVFNDKRYNNGQEDKINYYNKNLSYVTVRMLFARGKYDDVISYIKKFPKEVLGDDVSLARV